MTTQHVVLTAVKDVSLQLFVLTHTHINTNKPHTHARWAGINLDRAVIHILPSDLPHG